MSRAKSDRLAEAILEVCQHESIFGDYVNLASGLVRIGAALEGIAKSISQVAESNQAIAEAIDNAGKSAVKSAGQVAQQTYRDAETDAKIRELLSTPKSVGELRQASGFRYDRVHRALERLGAIRSVELRGKRSVGVYALKG